MKKQYLGAQELADVLEISKASAYTKIAQMNEQLREQGYQVIAGKIPIAYAKTKFFGIDFEFITKEEE